MHSAKWKRSGPSGSFWTGVVEGTVGVTGFGAGVEGLGAVFWLVWASSGMEELYSLLIYLGFNIALLYKKMTGAGVQNGGK